MSNDSYVVESHTNVNETGVVFAGFNKVALLIDIPAENAVIDKNERWRKYEKLSDLEQDFDKETIEYKKAYDFFNQDKKPNELYLVAKAADETFAACWDSFIEKKGGAYFVATTSTEIAIQKTLADDVEVADTRLKLVLTSNDVNIFDSSKTDDLASYVKSKDLKRTVVLYHAADEHYDMKLLGRVYSIDEGESWDNRVMKGLTVDNLSATQVQVLKSKNCGFLINIDDEAWSKEILSGNGWYADISRAIDYIDRSMDLKIIALLKDTDRPKNNHTMTLIKAAVTEVMEEGIDRNIVDANTLEINVPLASDLKPGRDINLDNLYTFNYLHSMHKIVINGSVTI